MASWQRIFDGLDLVRQFFVGLLDVARVALLDYSLEHVGSIMFWLPHKSGRPVRALGKFLGFLVALGAPFLYAKQLRN